MTFDETGLRFLKRVVDMDAIRFSETPVFRYL